MHRLLNRLWRLPRLLPWNPADPIKPPRLKRKTMRALDTAETAALLEAARAYRLFMPVILAITCGLRRAEICALRWRHIELTGHTQLSVAAARNKRWPVFGRRKPRAGVPEP
jgi:integrase